MFWVRSYQPRRDHEQILRDSPRTTGNHPPMLFPCQSADARLQRAADSFPTYQENVLFLLPKPPAPVRRLNCRIPSNAQRGASTLPSSSKRSIQYSNTSNNGVCLPPRSGTLSVLSGAAYDTQTLSNIMRNTFIVRLMNSL